MAIFRVAPQKAPAQMGEAVVENIGKEFKTMKGFNCDSQYFELSLIIPLQPVE